jgi:hypothetical protein
VIGAASSLTVLTNEWKYIEPNKGNAYSLHTNTELGNNPEDQLYNITIDRGEYDNVAVENPLMVKFMKQILEEEKAKGMGLEL